MAWKASEVAGGAGWETFSISVPSTAFWRPPRRSWPHPPRRLEQLAFRVGVGDEELRELLHDAIQHRLREKGDAWKQLDETIEGRERRSAF